MRIKLGKIIILLVTSLMITVMICYFSLDRIFPKIDYNNNIELDLAYLNYSDKLLIGFREKGSNDIDMNSIEIPSSQILNHLSLTVPYVYEPMFYLLFGESNPVTVAISNMYINSKQVDVHLIEKEFQNIGYKTFIKDQVVYAQPNGEYKSLVFNLYHISNSFINIDQDQLNKFLEEDQLIRLVAFCIIFLIIIILIRFITIKYTVLTSEFFLAHYSLLLQFVLLVTAVYSVYWSTIFEEPVSFLKILKNYLLIFLLPTFLIIVASFLSKSLIRFMLGILTIAFLLWISIDHFAQVVFGSRFFYNTTTKFAGAASDSLPFLRSYILSYSGCFFISSLAIVIAIYLLGRSKYYRKKKYLGSLGILLLLSFGAIFVYNKNEDSQFYNTVQVNINGLFTEGDFKREYNSYVPFNYDQLEYKEYLGLNQKQNVIVLLVESLACDMTYLCGDEYDYSPYMKQLAKENILFPNYYSNNFHTNGAIFTITTGLSLINGPHGEEAYFNKELYRADLINAFSNAGYRTAYYSPANLVLNKKQQLEVSNYSYLSSAQDHYYDSFEKNGVFSSVTDEQMFDRIVNDLKDNQQPTFIMLTTISTHTPYITPWSSHNIERAFAYSDMAIKNFISNLNQIDYFKNGIVIVTGDHRGWGNNNDKIGKSSQSKIENEKVPMILIDGKHKGVIFDQSYFSHSSLGVMLEYMMLPTYKKSKYQINPLVDQGSEVILHYNAQDPNTVFVKLGSKEDQVLLDGDQTRFLKHELSEDQEKDILGLISFIRK